MPALRTVGHGEDSTQQILVREVARLSRFAFRSLLMKWAWTDRVNGLVDFLKWSDEKERRKREQMAEDSTAGVRLVPLPEVVHPMLTEEIRIARTLRMLQCLDRPLRTASRRRPQAQGCW